jgi:adhesin/invasin
VVVGDIDLDGKLDLLVGNNTDASVILLKGLGTGKFTFGPTTGMGTGLTSLVGGDVDGDGQPDLVATLNADSRVAVLRSKGLGLAGTALQPVQSTTGAASARGILVADVNKDGKPDLLTANRSTNKVSLLLGDGAGNFTLSATAPTVGTSPAYLASGDVDRDGNLDVVVANTSVSTPSFSVLLGDGNGGLTKTVPDPTVPQSPKGVVLEDFNSDGAPDLLTTGGGSVYLRLNTGAGTFGAVSTFGASGSSQAVAVADFNRDGKLDVVSGNNSTTSTVAVLLGNGAGSLATPAKTQGLPGAAWAVAVGDFDRDGKVDLAVTITSGANYDVKVLRGKGDGTFDAVAMATLTFSSPSFPEFLAAGDVDGDGRLDLATVVLNSDAVLVWRGDGSGSFAAPVVWGSSDQTQSVTLADVNGDGLTDVITGGFNLVGVLMGR